MRTILPGDDCAGLAPCVATIGFFDGVHRGHRHLIGSVIDEAGKIDGAQSAVITFDRHPRQVLHAEFQPALLTTMDEKIELLSITGVDNCVVLHFDRIMASMSAFEFMRNVLRDRLGVRKLITGYDHRFGHNRAETFDDYVSYGRELGIEVVRGDAFMLDGVGVSSSVIRAFLSEGEVRMAARCLGYNYFLSGCVVKGQGNGHKIGFPTANIGVDDDTKLIPAPGIYAVKVRPEGCAVAMNGMMNIGTRPTFDGSGVTLEVNIFDFDGDIYGRRIEVMFVGRLRDERRFASISRLAEQLKADREDALRLLTGCR